MNKLFFGEKRDIKTYERIANVLLILMINYFSLILKARPLFSVKDFLFLIFLLIMGLMNSSVVALVEDQAFFSVRDRKKRFIISRILQTVLFCTILIIAFLYFQFT